MEVFVKQERRKSPTAAWSDIWNTEPANQQTTRENNASTECPIREPINLEKLNPPSGNNHQTQNVRNTNKNSDRANNQQSHVRTAHPKPKETQQRLWELLKCNAEIRNDQTRINCPGHCLFSVNSLSRLKTDYDHTFQNELISDQTSQTEVASDKRYYTYKRTSL